MSDVCHRCRTPRLAFKPINATPGLVVPFCVLSCRAAARDRDPLRRGLGFVYGDRDRSLHVPLCRDRRAVTSALVQVERGISRHYRLIGVFLFALSVRYQAV